jgi:hypothetical protein
MLRSSFNKGRQYSHIVCQFYVQYQAGEGVEHRAHTEPRIRPPNTTLQEAKAFRLEDQSILPGKTRCFLTRRQDIELGRIVHTAAEGDTARRASAHNDCQTPHGDSR